MRRRMMTKKGEVEKVWRIVVELPLDDDMATFDFPDWFGVGSKVQLVVTGVGESEVVRWNGGSRQIAGEVKLPSGGTITATFYVRQVDVWY